MIALNSVDVVVVLKQEMGYEIGVCEWGSEGCSSDLEEDDEEDDENIRPVDGGKTERKRRRKRR